MTWPDIAFMCENMQAKLTLRSVKVFNLGEGAWGGRGSGGGFTSIPSKKGSALKLRCGLQP